MADGGLDDREREGIGVVLCDVVLPGTHGPELVEELRARLPGVPVVFMSGYSGDELGPVLLRLLRLQEGDGGAP